MSEQKHPMTAVQKVFRALQALRSEIAPIARIAAMVQDPTEKSPTDMMISILESTLASIEQVRLSQEKMVAVLCQPVVEKAVRDLLKG